MAWIRVWTLGLVCCVLTNTVSLQRIVSHYNWQNEISSENGRLTYSLKDRPNIIIILADDMGWGDMGANWAETTDTPNLDALAKDGLRLSDMHSGASVCAPSRAALLTGRLGLRTGVVRNFGTEALGGLPHNETTFAEVLRAAGYRTAMLGKWHLGLQPGHHPLDKGFDKYLGVPYSVDMGCTDDPAANWPSCPTCPLDASSAPAGNASAAAGAEAGGCFEDLALPLLRDRAIAHQPLNLSTLAEEYARFGEDFILGTSAGEGAAAAAGQPYLLYAALAHVHVPLVTSARFVNASRGGPLGAALRELDWLAGRLAKAADAASLRWPQRSTLLWFLRRTRVGGAGVGAGRAAHAGLAGRGAAAARALLRRPGPQRPLPAPGRPRAHPQGAVPSQQRSGGEGGRDRRCSCGRPQSGILLRRGGDVRGRDGPLARPAAAAGVQRGRGPRGGAAAGRAGGGGGAQSGGARPGRPARQPARRQHLPRRLQPEPPRKALLQRLQRRLQVPLGLAHCQEPLVYFRGCLQYHHLLAAALASGVITLVLPKIRLLLMDLTSYSLGLESPCVEVKSLSLWLTSLVVAALFPVRVLSEIGKFLNLGYKSPASLISIFSLSTRSWSIRLQRVTLSSRVRLMSWCF